MRRQPNRRGFTIIEVMLFLAITGLMMAGVMAAVTGGINRQRYEDATASLSDFIQGQYNLVDNVVTNRPETVSCSSSGGIDETGSSPVQPRGTSDCTIIGRYITSETGEKLISRPVYATADITQIDKTLPEAEKLKQYKLTTASANLDTDDATYNIAWSTFIYTDKLSPNRGDGDFSMVLLKMPDSSLTRSFAVQQKNQSVQEVIDNTSGDSLLMCVATDGLVGSPPAGIKIMLRAANVTAVQPVKPGSGECS